MELGADINHANKEGNFALQHAVNQRNFKEIHNLCDKGADTDQRDPKGRSLLHHAVNVSQPTTEANFDLEKILIKKGCDMNALDNRGRTPLTYAFIKIGQPKETSEIDPIETVSSYCGYKDIDTDVPDAWGKTPLHYAAQRGSMISSIYLLKRGVDINKTDIYGNSPLGIALLHDHQNYAVILLQNNCDVKAPLFKPEDTFEIKNKIRAAQGLELLKEGDKDEKKPEN